MIRYRLFRHRKYVSTHIVDKTEQEVLDEVYPTAELGDIIYVGDYFFLRGKTMWGLLGAEDPLVNGLYGQAVKAEQATVKAVRGEW